MEFPIFHIYICFYDLCEYFPFCCLVHFTAPIAALPHGHLWCALGVKINVGNALQIVF